MTSFSVCAFCLHRTEGDMLCDAFPDGIPNKLFLGELQHIKPVDGDGGIVFGIRDDLSPVETDRLMGILEPMAEPEAKRLGGMIRKTFTEADHPRDNAGKFGSGSSAHAEAAAKQAVPSKNYAAFIAQSEQPVTPHTRNAHLPGGEILVDVRGTPENIQSNYAHEMGHKIYDYLLSDGQRQEFEKVAKIAQEKYGKGRGITGDAIEDFPEVFSAWVSGDEWQHTGEIPKGKEWRPARYGGMAPEYQEFMTENFGPPKKLDVPANLQNARPDTSVARDRTGRRIRDLDT